MITKKLLSELYDQAKVNYEFAENNWLKYGDSDYKEEMVEYTGEMFAYGKLLKMLN